MPIRLDIEDDFVDVETEAQPSARYEQRSSYRLEVLNPDGPSAVFDIESDRPGRALLGTGPACDLRVRDREVSRRHVAFDVAAEGLRVTDLGSTNGTWVNGLRIQEAYLRGGETIQLGKTTLKVVHGSARAPKPPALSHFASVVGESHAMRRLYRLFERLAASDVPLLIEGETGTGKEQLARSLHTAGARCDGPFVVLDCTAIAPSMIESELFGHERGAFTGSMRTHIGVFERAHGGTLFIDEIGDLPLELQPKLLRAVERSEVRRVGGDDARRVDVRLLAATRRDLDREVQSGRFRDDLFHRIAVTRLELPPLRERKGDVRLLVEHFVSELGGAPNAVPSPLIARWEDLAWPGNVRELRNAVARWLALGELGDQMEASDLEGRAAARASGGSGGDAISHVLSLDLPLLDARRKMLETFDARYVESVLERYGGNVTRAAAAAGITRRHLQRLKAGREEDG